MSKSSRSNRNSGTAKRKLAQSKGFRSYFEYEVALELKEQGCDYGYETGTIEFQWQDGVYTPDFFLPNGIIVETKGRFTSRDRNKHLLIKAQSPEHDIRFVFLMDNKLSPKSKTRYSDWCKKYGFKYSFKRVPKEWLNES